MIPPDALLFLHAACPHCPAVLAALGQLLKEGVIGRLEAVNIAVHPAPAESLGVRSVPWCRIGPFELEGRHTPAELRHWAEQAAQGTGMGAYFDRLLRARGLAKVERLITDNPAYLADLLPLVGDPETAMQTRLGIGALLEAREGQADLQTLVTPLGELSRHPDHRVRTDACHYLGLSHSRAALPWLRACLQDPRAEVRETAADSLALLETVFRD